MHKPLPFRIRWEMNTVHKMLCLYCKHHHSSSKDLCENCQELLCYANKRIKKCQFFENKPTCEQCTVHCYSPKYQKRIQKIMRWAGPRMLLYHPKAALLHLYYKFFEKKTSYSKTRK